MQQGEATRGDFGETFLVRVPGDQHSRKCASGLTRDFSRSGVAGQTRTKPVVSDDGVEFPLRLGGEGERFLAAAGALLALRFGLCQGEKFTSSGVLFGNAA